MTLSQAITAMEGAREAYYASLRNWNKLVALSGEDRFGVMLREDFPKLVIL